MDSPGAIFALLLTWLGTGFTARATAGRARPLVREVTGEELTPQYLVRYLQRKFGALYGFAGEDS